MRNSKLIGCLICLLALCCILTSCDMGGTTPAPEETTSATETTTKAPPSGGANQEVTTTPAPVVTTEPEKDPKDMPHNELLLLGGVNITSYKIVYGHSPVENTMGSKSGDTVWQDLVENSFTYDPETGEKVETPFLLGDNRECNFDYESALRLQALIKEVFGYELLVVKDTDATQESRYEILVGNTNREATVNMIQRKYLEKPENIYLDEYVCGFNTNRVVKVEVLETDPETGEQTTKETVTYPQTTQFVICGGSYGATWHAIDALEEYFKNPPVTNTPAPATDSDAPAALVVDIKYADDISKVYGYGGYDFKAVACLGDSITRGSQGFPDANQFGTVNGFAQSVAGSMTATYLEQFLSYPANLQRALWKDYLVCNYGQGNSTMIDPKVDTFPDGGPFYYNDFGSDTGRKFAECLKYSNRDDFEFDAVLIMLGTNDAGQRGGADKWTSATKQEYMDEAENLIRQISEGSPDAKFVLMNAPHRCDGNSEIARDTAVRELQTKTAQWLKDKGYDMYCYNMEQYTIEHLSANGGCCQEPDNADEMSASELADYLKQQELAAHQDYYNILTDSRADSGMTGGTADTTHPNFRGYAKIAEGLVHVLQYLLEGAEAPSYMIGLE